MHNPKVKLNSEVTIEMGGKTRTVTIVKRTEIGLSKGIISEDSPLGKILMGMSIDDITDFESPSRKVVEVSILRIRKHE